LPVATRRFRFVGCHLRRKNVPSTESSAANLLITDATEAASNTHRCSLRGNAIPQTSRATASTRRNYPQLHAGRPRCIGAILRLHRAEAAAHRRRGVRRRTAPTTVRWTIPPMLRPRVRRTHVRARAPLCGDPEGAQRERVRARPSTPRHSASQRNPNRFIRRTTLPGPIRA
jgi:hypothetical protein